MARKTIEKRLPLFLTTLTVGVAAIFVSFFIFDPAYAQLSAVAHGIVPQCNWKGGETYGLGAFVLLASNVMKLIWGIAGSLALLMFIWGGFQWLTAAGEEARVKAGWDTFINATIGIAIVLGSWVIINTVMLFLVSPGQFTTAQIFGQTWVQIATNNNVCIKSADLARGSVPPPIVSSPTSRTSVADHVACCYKRKDGVKRASDLDYADCKENTKKLFADGAILGDPIFHCKYSGPVGPGQLVTATDICWSVDASRGNKPTYCTTRDDLTIAGSSTTPIPELKGVCCISEEQHNPTAKFIGYSIKDTTLSSCKGYQDTWRSTAGQAGVFGLVFCTNATNESVCGTNNNGYSNISCPKKVDFDPKYSADQIQQQIEEAAK